MPGQRNDLESADQGMQELISRFTAPAPAGPALSVDVAGGLEVQVGRLATLMEREQDNRARRRAELAAAIYPFDFVGNVLAGSGTLDEPMILGVRDGFCMDIKILVAASFSAGSVAVYKNGVADAFQRGAFTSAGTLTYSGQSLLLQPGERLLFVASGITGNVTISGSAIMVRHDFLAEYLL